MVVMEEFMKRLRVRVKNGSHLVKVAIFLHGRFTFHPASVRGRGGAGQSSPLPPFLLPAHLPRPLVGIAIVG